MQNEYISAGYTKSSNSPSRVTDSEATGFNTTHGSRTNDQNLFFLGLDQDFSRLSLWDTLCNQCNGTNALEFETLQGTAVHTPRARKVDDDIDIRVLLDGLSERGVHRQQRLPRAPIELLDVVTTERVNHRSDGRTGALARVVEIKHTLDSTRLETVDKAAGLGIEWTVSGSDGGMTILGRSVIETHDDVVGLGTFAGGVNRSDVGRSRCSS